MQKDQNIIKDKSSDEFTLSSEAVEIKAKPSLREMRQRAELIPDESDDLWQSYKAQQTTDLDTEKLMASEDNDDEFSLDDSF